MEIGQEAEIERLENNFFDRYWPGTGDGNSTAASLADLEDPNVEDAGKHRASKTARLQESKGERGKGNAAYGSYGKRREREYSTGSQAWRRQQTAWDEWTEEASSSKSVKALQEEIKIMQDKVFALQKMALRHEDFSTCLKSELSWVMFMKVDMRASVVPCLYQMQRSRGKDGRQNSHILPANHHTWPGGRGHKGTPGLAQPTGGNAASGAEHEAWAPQSFGAGKSNPTANWMMVRSW